MTMDKETYELGRAWGQVQVFMAIIEWFDIEDGAERNRRRAACLEVRQMLKEKFPAIKEQFPGESK